MTMYYTRGNYHTCAVCNKKIEMELFSLEVMKVNNTGKLINHFFMMFMPIIAQA